MGVVPFFRRKKRMSKRLQTEEIQVTLVGVDVNGHGKKGCDRFC